MAGRGFGHGRGCGRLREVVLADSLPRTFGLTFWEINMKKILLVSLFLIGTTAAAYAEERDATATGETHAAAPAANEATGAPAADTQSDKIAKAEDSQDDAAETQDDEASSEEM